MTFEELIQLTKIQECPDCHLKHAIVRTCAEAKLEYEFSNHYKEAPNVQHMS